MKHLLILLVFYFLNTISQGQERVNNTWLRFQNQAMNYQFSYHPLWEVKGIVGGYVVTPKNEKQKLETEISMTASPNGNDSTQNYLEALQEKLFKNINALPNQEVTRVRNKILGNYLGKEIEFFFTVSKKDTSRIHSIIWLINRGNLIYRIAYRGSAKEEKNFFRTIADIIETFSFLDQPPLLNTPVLKGTWQGTLVYDDRKTSKRMTSPISIIFKDHDTSTSYVRTTQAIIDPISNKKDTVNVNIRSYFMGEIFTLLYTEVTPDKKEHSVKLNLHHQFKDGSHFLEGVNADSTEFYVGLKLQKLSDDTSFKKAVPSTQSNAGDEVKVKPEQPKVDLSPGAALLFKTIVMLDPKEEGKVVDFEITDKEKEEIFKASKLQLKDNNLFIEDANDDPFEAAVNVYDFNDDRKYEIILWKHNKLGPVNTSEFTVYYRSSNGKYREILSDYGYPDALKSKEFGFHNIAIAGPGFQTPIYSFDGTKYRFVRNTSAEEMKPLDESKLVGGSTPDELGRILLKALKTNDKNLWMHCIHPIEEKYRELSEQQFQRIRNKLEEKGLSNWSSVNFSRVTYDKEYMGSQDNGVVNGEQVRRNFVIEFYYRNKEFIGGIGKMTIETYKNSNYFIYFPGYDAGLTRYKKR